MKQILNILVFFVFVLSGCSNIINFPIGTQTQISVSPTNELSKITPTTDILGTPTKQNTNGNQSLYDFMSTNGNCDLPCVWGLSPGISNESNAQNVLLQYKQLADNLVFSKNFGTISIISQKEDYQIYSKLSYLTDTIDEKVMMIEYKIEAHKPLSMGGYEEIINKDSFGDYTSFYDLKSVLTNLGEPVDVYIGTLASDYSNGGNWGFHILLWYPNYGLLIDYKTKPDYTKNKIIIGCPKNASVTINSFIYNDETRFHKIFNETDWPQNISFNYRLLSEVTELSKDDFVNLYLKNLEWCINTPIDEWPLAD